MKCTNCEYLYQPEQESNYTLCRVFGDEIPDKYSRKDEEGCVCNRKQLAKMFYENEEAWMEEAKAFVDWYKAESEGGMNTIDIMDCGEISCEYCNKDKCVYMTDNEEESEG